MSVSNVLHSFEHELTSEAQHTAEELKAYGRALYEYIDTLSASPVKELEAAKQKVEEAVLWAMQHVRV